MTEEKQIENAIFSYFRLRKIFAFKVNTTGLYDPVRGAFRKLSKNCIPGTADIIACVQGRFVAFEVKSRQGIQSPQQKEFEALTKLNQGYYFLVRSVSEVRSALDLLSIVILSPTYPFGIYSEVIACLSHSLTRLSR